MDVKNVIFASSLLISDFAYKEKMASSDLEKSFREYTKTENVFLFVPNIIGYVMVFRQVYSFYDLLSL